MIPDFIIEEGSERSEEESLTDMDNSLSDENEKTEDSNVSEEIIEELSKERKEPSWVLDIRLKALEQFFKMDDPDWGPDISYLNIDDIATYVKPVDGEVRKWEDVPEDIRNVFDKL